MFRVSDVLVLQDGEKVHAVVRRHGWTLLPRLVLAGALIALPFFFLLTLISWGKVGLAFFASSVAAGLLVALQKFIVWDADALIVTSRRLVDVDQRGIFLRAVSETPLALVHDVGLEPRGIGQRLFRVGTLRIRTGGSMTEWLVPDIAAPSRVRELINAACDRCAL